MQSSLSSDRCQRMFGLLSWRAFVCCAVLCCAGAVGVAAQTGGGCSTDQFNTAVVREPGPGGSPCSPSLAVAAQFDGDTVLDDAPPPQLGWASVGRQWSASSGGVAPESGDGDALLVPKDASGADWDDYTVEASFTFERGGGGSGGDGDGGASVGVVFRAASSDGGVSSAEEPDDGAGAAVDAAYFLGLSTDGATFQFSYLLRGAWTTIKSQSVAEAMGGDATATIAPGDVVRLRVHASAHRFSMEFMPSLASGGDTFALFGGEVLNFAHELGGVGMRASAGARGAFRCLAVLPLGCQGACTGEGGALACGQGITCPGEGAQCAACAFGCARCSDVVTCAECAFGYEPVSQPRSAAAVSCSDTKEEDTSGWLAIIVAVFIAVVVLCVGFGVAVALLHRGRLARAREEELAAAPAPAPAPALHRADTLVRDRPFGGARAESGGARGAGGGDADASSGQHGGVPRAPGAAAGAGAPASTHPAASAPELPPAADPVAVAVAAGGVGSKGGSQRSMVSADSQLPPAHAEEPPPGQQQPP